MACSQYASNECFLKADSYVYIEENPAKYRYELPNHQCVVNHPSPLYCTKLSREKGMVHECMSRSTLLT